MNHFSTRLLSAMKSRFYMTTSDDQLNGWAEKNLQSTSQSQTCTKKMSWSLFGGLLPIWSSIAFWIPVNQLYLISMLRDVLKSAIPEADIGQQKATSSSWQCPTACCTTITSKWIELGSKVLPHLPYLPDLLSIDYQFFKHLDSFLQGKCFHNQQDTENAFQEFVES